MTAKGSATTRVVYKASEKRYRLGQEDKMFQEHNETNYLIPLSMLTIDVQL